MLATRLRGRGFRAVCSDWLAAPAVELFSGGGTVQVCWPCIHLPSPGKRR